MKNTLKNIVDAFVSNASNRMHAIGTIAFSLALTLGLTLGAKADTQACNDCITFSSKSAFTVLLNKSPSAPTVNLECSTDKTYWSPYVQNKDHDAAQVGGEYVFYLRGTNNTVFATGTGKNQANTFILSGDDGVACSGNIETLLDYREVAKGNHPEMGPYAFALLFYQCGSLTTAPTLPAEELTESCYAYMFKYCSSLTAAPALPATTLTDNCYDNMFSCCPALTTAPTKLPAEKMTSKCYNSMFNSCSSLTNAPALPATNLAVMCYNCMFCFCSSLKVAPELPATDLSYNCYNGMFQKCPLTTLPVLNVHSVTNTSCSWMFQDCTNLVVNTEGPGVEWCIPSDVKISSQAEPTEWYYWAKEMFKGTAGTITNSSEVTPGVTYYIASAPVKFDVVKPEGATFQAYTNEVPVDVPCTAVASNAFKVVYTADAGYVFPDGKTTMTTNVTASTVSVTVTLTAEQQPKPLSPIEYRAPVYKEVGGITSPTNGIEKWENLSTNVYTVVESSASRVTWGTAGATSWYVVTNGTFQIDGGVACAGHVNLILCDGAKLTVTNVANNCAGIQTDASGSFTVYGQSAGTGKLDATGGECGAGIGGGWKGAGSNITINGGTVTAKGHRYGGAGIGGGDYGAGSNITINGGTVTATAGDYSGAGIGGGTYSIGSSITINGGKVTAMGGSGGAGIGGGSEGMGSSITINGGTVTATGSNGGAGIGSGSANEEGVGNGSNITINGGTVTANGGKYGAGIGGGWAGAGLNITVRASATVYACSGSDADAIGNGRGSEVAAEGNVIETTAKVFFNLTGQSVAPLPETFDGFVVMTPGTQTVSQVLVRGAPGLSALPWVLTNAVTGAKSDIAVNAADHTDFANTYLRLTNVNDAITLKVDGLSFAITQQPNITNLYTIAAETDAHDGITKYGWYAPIDHMMGFGEITNANMEIYYGVVEDRTIKSVYNEVNLKFTLGGANALPEGGSFHFTCDTLLEAYVGELIQNGSACVYTPKTKSRIEFDLMADSAFTISDLTYEATVYDNLVADGKTLTIFPMDKGMEGSNYLCRVTYRHHDTVCTADSEVFEFRAVAQVSADDVTGATVLAAYTNEVSDATKLPGSSPWTVVTNATVAVVYQADSGYVFTNGNTVFTNTVKATEAETSATLKDKQLPIAVVKVEIPVPNTVWDLVYDGTEQIGITNIDARLTVGPGVTNGTDAVMTNCTFTLPDDNVFTNYQFANTPAGKRTLKTWMYIDPRPITLKSASATKVWDGTELTTDKVEVVSGSYAPNEEFVYEVTGKQTAVGWSTNFYTVAENTMTTPKTKLSNYEITREYGILTVTDKTMPPVAYRAPVYKDVGGIVSPTNGIKEWVNLTTNIYTVVTSETEAVTWNAGWYVVTNEVTLSLGAQCNGAVHLILADGAKLSAQGGPYTAGIQVQGDGVSLAIYGQAADSGELIATGGGDESIQMSGSAGIGSGYGVQNAPITINGGTVKATGGHRSAGIAGARSGDKNGSVGNVTINGGAVTATGDAMSAGIGGGSCYKPGGICRNIVINGGTVTAKGGTGSAAIGGAKNCTGENIKINGGKVKATAGQDCSNAIGDGASGY